jgi:hypothetical protein
MFVNQQPLSVVPRQFQQHVIFQFLLFFGTFHAGISLSNEIVGCNMDISTLDCKLTSAIKQNFKEYQVEVALITSWRKLSTLSSLSLLVFPHIKYI